MYEQYWGLTQTPFQQPAEDEGFYCGEPQGEALARLEFVVNNSQRLATLLGASGSGKSLILERAARQFRRAGHKAAVVNLLGLGEEDFTSQVADALAVSYQERESYATVWRGILDELTVNRCQNLKTILFFDDADEADPGVLKNVIRLNQWKPGEDTQVTTVLCANSRRTHKLGDRLNELSDLRVDLYPWELGDIAGFLEQSLAAVGRTESLFQRSAYESLFVLSDGVPRRVRQLAELSLLAAAGEAKDVINRETVEAVHTEFKQLQPVGP